MTKLTTEAGLALWERALASEIGIGIKTKDKRLLSNALYESRKGRPDLQSLILILPAKPLDEVWICHKQQKLED